MNKVEEPVHNKQVYKNQKRKVRNKLIYLVGLHLLYIFGFVALLCFEYLIPKDWGNAFYLSITSDICFWCYILQTLAAIKFKNRKLLISSILTLGFAIACKAGALYLMIQQDKEVFIQIYVHIVLLLLNCVIPWSLLMLWNKLNQKKWRQTFDLYTKLNSHLEEEVKK